MAEIIERGIHGLYYLTDSDDRTMFIAGTTEDDARLTAEEARIALVNGGNVRGHTLHDYERGGRLFVPDPEHMTAEQRAESIERMKRHLEQRFNN